MISLIILMILGMILLVNSVNAGTIFWGADQRYGNETFERGDISLETNWSLISGCIEINNMLRCTGTGSKAIYINQMPDVSTNSANWTAEWKGNTSCTGNGDYYAFFSVGNDSGNSMAIHTSDSSPVNMDLRDNTNGQVTSIPNGKADGTVHQWKVVIGKQEIAVYINDTWQASRTWTGGQMQFFRVSDHINCVAFYDNITFYNTSVYPKISDIPSVNLNIPLNSSNIHNTSIKFNFTITEPNGDKFNYTLWADTNSNPTTSINNSLNTTDITISDILIYRFIDEIAGSINRTYYWKINGTDNNTNKFESSILTFNITNNINLYNATNVTLNTSPINSQDPLRIYFNLTNKIGQNDTINMSEIRWFINGSQVVTATNNTILNAPNVTLDSNITAQVRINKPEH